MAPVVACAGVPHTVVCPDLATRRAGAGIARAYARVRNLLNRAAPEVVVVLATDHVRGMSLDACPTFAINTDDLVTTTDDPINQVPTRPLPVHTELPAHLHRQAMKAAFDTTILIHEAIDHSVTIPLYFLNDFHALPNRPGADQRSDKSATVGIALPGPSGRCYATPSKPGRSTRGWR